MKGPDPNLLDDCVHCGYCLPTCPTYELWGEEMDSPRGRIVLMGRDRLSDSMVTHFDRCLGCMACVTSCPSGVQYDRLIEAVRPEVERDHRRGLADRVWRRFLLGLFPHPGRLRATVPLLALAQATGLARLTQAPFVKRRFPRAASLGLIAPQARLGAAVSRTPAPVAQGGRAKVGLLLGCVQRVYFGHVNQATVRVLAAEGYDVVAPRLPRCCGALQQHAGEEEEARALARQAIEAFEGCDLVVANAAGCGAALKAYGHLLATDAARAFSADVRDVTELLAAAEPVAPRHPVPMKVVYHEACHLAHAQRIRAEPRALLRTIPGLEILEPADWEICCGSAGVYNLLQPEAAYQLGRRKAEQLLATGAEAVVTANPGCALQLAAHLRELGRPLPIYHPVELLDRSLTP